MYQIRGGFQKDSIAQEEKAEDWKTMQQLEMQQEVRGTGNVVRTDYKQMVREKIHAHSPRRRKKIQRKREGRCKARQIVKQKYLFL